jgi:hypothetical protein
LASASRFFFSANMVLGVLCIYSIRVLGGIRYSITRFELF